MAAPVRPGDPVSFWLIPAEPWRGRLQATIDRLSHRFGTPRFDAHITMHVGVAGQMPVEAVVDAVAAEFPIVRLLPGPTGHTEARFKTLFIAFDDPVLVRMHRGFRQLLGTESDYVFAPHLSLLYGPLPEPTRAELAGATDHRDAAIEFDSIAIGLPAPGAADWSAVDGWRITAQRVLPRRSAA